MKQIILLTCSLLFINATYAQTSGKTSLWNGTGKFIIGTDRSMYGLDIKATRGDSSGKNKVYDYLPAKDFAVIVAGAKFNMVNLFFDEKDKLTAVMMFGTFKKTDSTDYLKEAEQAAYKIMLYLKNKLKKKGIEKDKREVENSGAIQYAWKKEKREILFSIVQGKIPGHEFVMLSLGFGTSPD